MGDEFTLGLLNGMSFIAASILGMAAANLVPVNVALGALAVSMAVEAFVLIRMGVA